MDKVIQTFEGLIRRSIAPSVTFFVIFGAGELIAAEVAGGSAAEAFAGSIEGLAAAFGEADGFFAAAAVLLVLGVGYGLSAAQQVLFDNRLKKNFEPGPRWAWLRWIFARRLVRWFRSSVESEGRALRELRTQVLDRFEKEPALARFRPVEEWTDYVLYEILGGIDPTDTRSFVDTAKSIGIVFSSAIAVTLWNLGIHFYDLPWRWRLALLAAVVVFYWLGREATAAQYRMRALRLYVNFLMMPTKRLQRRLLLPDEKAE